MTLFRKFSLLLWKNFLLQKRKPISTLIELFLPIFFIFILLILRMTSIQAHPKPKYRWENFEVDGKIPITGHIGRWEVAFSPNTTQNIQVMNMFKNYADVDVVAFEREKSLQNAIVTDENNLLLAQKLLCGVVFDTSHSEKVIKYRLRFPSNPRNGGKANPFFPSKWFTEFVYPFTFQGLGPRTKGNDSDDGKIRTDDSKYGGPPPYFKDGFLAVQRAVDFAIIKLHNQSFDRYTVKTLMNRFPFPPRIEDQFIIIIQNSFPMLLMLSLVYTALSIVKNIVYEKEKKLKESMKMMGLSGWLHWFAWFTKCLIFLLFPLIIITILMTVQFGDGNGKMLNESDGSLVFVFLLLYAISSIMFCFFVSTLFYRANFAAAAGGIFWFLSYVPYFFLFNFYDQMTLTSKVAACLDFQIAMSFGANLIGRFEGSGAGVNWSNVNEGVTIDESFTFAHVLVMLILDSILYGVLTWYIEGVFPGEYGIPKKWYFPFSKKYWCDKQDIEAQALLPLEDEESNLEDNLPSDIIEKDPENLRPGINIRNLKKEFPTESGKKLAVNNLNLKLYEGQITALLGHNGAGKTTTISMLTGLIPPTAGNAYINGYDIINNMASIRSSLGICPQHNVLFDALTVKEHLWFFMSLKGIDDEQKIKQEVDKMIDCLGLVDKTNIQSRNLSGGMKRKLSVGIALVGDSKIVILDEPTSGMDVSARRFTWDLLQRERQGRTILLTTHYMDEADVLGDRIAIMSNGQIRCSGSSLFLKNKYGVGYHMVMVKEPGCDVSMVSNIVNKYIPTAKLESNVGLELSFVLPSDFSHKFEELFTEIEETRQALKISSYGASVTTLEEVFIKVGEEEELNNDAHKKLFRQLSGKDNGAYSPEETSLPDHRPSSRMHENSTSSFGSLEAKNQGKKLAMQRWYAMFVKKLIHSKRHKVSLVSQLLMPSIFVMLSLIVVKTMPKAQDSPKRLLDLNMFGENNVPLMFNNRSSFTKDLDKSFQAYLRHTNGRPLTLNSSVNMSQYLLSQEIDLAKFNQDNLVAFELKEESKTIHATYWFNNEALHSSAVAVNTLSNALLTLFTPRDSNKRIDTTNDPLPTTSSQSIKDLSSNPNGFQIGFSLCFGMSFLASSFIVFLVQERATKAKHVQFVSGVDPISYWTSSYLWDLINFMLPCLVIIILFFAFQVEAFEGIRVGYVSLLLVLYGWAVIPLMYMFSFMFEVASTAFVRMTILNVITGLAMLLVVFILSIPTLNLLDVADVLKWVFLIFPNYNLGQGVIDIFNNYNLIKTYDDAVQMCVDLGRKQSPTTPPDIIRKFCIQMVDKMFNDQSQIPHFERNYLSWTTPGIGRYLIFLALEGFVFFGIVLMIESGYFRWVHLLSEWISTTFYRTLKSCSMGTVTMVYTDGHVRLDSDVINEQTRIRNQEYGSNNVLVLKELCKTFNTSEGPLKAVDNLSLGVPHGECFGLLGQNGAGKTTTFRILTGDEAASSGNAYVDRYDIASDLAKVRQRIGYCPQFDALIDLMTGREILTMYSRLRGVPEENIQYLVERLSRNLGVEQYIDKLSKTYSGGNKRKLSTAIALAGDPPLIFLDEPSSGMDPVARRNLWDSLSRFIADGKSIVITSHSMEECEALCTRLAIMVNGQFKCLGSPQHLKTKFGEGYTLIARVGGSDPDTSSLKSYIKETFPGSILKDEHLGYMHYQLKAENKTWANLFGVMERAKVKYNIEDYSISQTTLEQVFLNFTRNQRVTDE